MPQPKTFQRMLTLDSYVSNFLHKGGGFLKLDGSEKLDGSRKRSSLRFSLRLWRSRVIFNLNVSVMCKKLISVSACYR
jgi:hypothetical protein